MLHSATLTFQLVYILGSHCKKRPWSNNNGQLLGVVTGVDLTTWLNLHGFCLFRGPVHCGGWRKL